MADKTDIPSEKLRKLNNVHKKDTDSALKDKLYNKIIDRYTHNSRMFDFSDRFVWVGAIYSLPEIFGYIIFFMIFYFIGGLVYNKYGYSRLFMLFALLLLWRVNIMVGYLKKINKKLGDSNG